EEEREREKEQTAAGEDPLLQLENSTPTSSPALNITAQVGHPVYLHCIVESLGDKMVSWIRLRDFHLLTIGSLTYIQDDRFAVRPATSHQGSSGSASNDWSLQIKHVTVRDEVPVSEIVGNPDIFVRSGAPINVTCLISSSPAPPAFVFWYHNNRMINYDYGGGNSGGGSGGQEGASGGTSGGSGGRGQISVAKDPNRADVVISRLLIRSAVLDDSGNYTCSPSNAEPASTYVHVLQGTDN
ncbi:PREDICTED: uncharacterized protein LOC108378403, partial [Rhagoletis zephyria]|uniref:uncharacterized protein LOC108378403 n=1 Tax=Rhagoletis zephyria TaxID=28612 RepID=UPI0008112960